MIVDLHCHTREYSPCAGDDLRSVVAAGLTMGLDGIAVTDHDVAYPEELLRGNVGAALGRMVVLRAVEATVETVASAPVIGHVLVFGADIGTGPWEDHRAFARAVRARGGALVLAHPLRYRDGAERLAELLPVQAIEVASTNVGREHSELARRLARRLGLPMVAGSDAHQARFVGRFATRFERDVATSAQVAEEIRAGRVVPVEWNGIAGRWE